MAEQLGTMKNRSGSSDISGEFVHAAEDQVKRERFLAERAGLPVVKPYFIIMVLFDLFFEIVESPVV